MSEVAAELSDEDKRLKEVMKGAPKPEYIQQVLPELFEHYKERNKYIALCRQHIQGTHEIEKPAATRFDVKTLHLWAFRSFVNERLARFLPRPRYRVVPPGISDTAISFATSLEKGLNTMEYWIRRQNDAWGNLVADVIMFDGGAMRTEMNLAAAYPDLSVNEDGEDNITRGLPTGMEDENDEDDPNARIERANKVRVKAREDYKKKQGIQKLFTDTYVPYEAFFPVPDNENEYLELEFRSLRKVIANERFDKIVRLDLEKRMKDDVKYATFAAQVPIVRYCDENVYAYYLVDEIDTLETNETGRLQRFIEKGSRLGNLRFLYAYRHEAGVPIYTHVIGMHGGWSNGNTDKVIGRVKALLELEGAQDEVASQVFTNVRETLWPTMKITYSDKRPAEGLDDGDVRKINPRGTQDIELFEGENVEPIFQPRPNPLVGDIMDRIADSMAKIGGAPGLYGVHQPGVEGGFQESQLLQQADSQYARIEGNIVTGAQNLAIVKLALIKASGEKIWIRSRKTKGKKEYFEDIAIDPEDLDPIPEIDAIVKALSQGNEAVALRNYITATSDVNGIPGTAPMARSSARQEFLAMESPDDEEVLVVKQGIMDRLRPVIMDEEVKKRYNLYSVEELMAQQGAAADPMGLMGMDPELASQMGMFAGGQAPPDPNAMMAPPMDPAMMGMPGPGVSMQGVGGGLPTGLGQPEATAGRIDQMTMAPVAPLP